MKKSYWPQMDHAVLAGLRLKRILITGGLGFIGSNLAHILVRQAGAQVSILDNRAENCGSNPKNIEGLEPDLELHTGDIGEPAITRPIVRNVDIIFNLAGSISHVDSMSDPYQDLAANSSAHLSFLESCRRENPNVRIILASTRQIYGRPATLPVDETHPLKPVDFNGIHKLLGEKYHHIFAGLCGIRPTFLRLTNTYGPRLLLRHPRQGFIGWFLHQAILGKDIQLYGGGGQLRDFTYVDDVAIAMLLAAVSEKAIGQTYNLGWGKPISLREFVETLAQLRPGLRYHPVDFPADRKPIDIGSYYSDSLRIKADLGWEPKVSLVEGLRRTLDFFEDHPDDYL